MRRLPVALTEKDKTSLLRSCERAWAFAEGSKSAWDLIYTDATSHSYAHMMHVLERHFEFRVVLTDDRHGACMSTRHVCCST